MSLSHEWLLSLTFWNLNAVCVSRLRSAWYLPARPSRPNSLVQRNIILRTILYALLFLTIYICILTWISFDAST
jgi:hypothetical protein